MTEQQKARIVELAARCESGFKALTAPPALGSYGSMEDEDRAFQWKWLNRNSAEAFRIAQEAR